MSETVDADVLIVGAGIAGASLAFFLAPQARVVLIERESQPGYHATGRSAALYIESYGPPHARALTRASRAFFDAPPPGFADVPILSPRGLLFAAEAGQESLLDAQAAMLAAAGAEHRRLDADEALALAPCLRRERLIGAIHEPDAADMDVDALHQGFLRGAGRAGARLVADAEIGAVARDGGDWIVEAGGSRFRAPVLADAAGAWADAVARLAGVPPIGLVPKRRTAFLFDPPAGVDVARWPAIIAADESWYLKPDAGRLLGSPANADPTEPQDVQPEELDVALGVHAIESSTTLSIRRPSRAWAGLRSFVADGELVGGFDPEAPGFFWVAGQGGYGIQTSAAMGEACAALLLGRPIPAWLADHGVSAQALSPARLR